MTRSAKHELLALDIGTEKIAGLLLEQNPTGPKLLEEWIAFRPPGSGQDWWQILLKQAIQQKQWGGKKTALVSSKIHGVVRRLQIPQAVSSELKNAIYWQIKGQFVFPVESAVVEYRVLGYQTLADGSQRIDVLVAAAPEAEVKELIGQITELSLRVTYVGLVPTSLENGISRTSYNTQTVAVLEIGSEMTSFLIVGKGVILFHRQLQVSGKTLTEALTGGIAMESGRVDISPQVAEELKKKYGIPDRHTTESDNVHSIPLNKIAVMIRPALERLNNEIRQTLDYYRVQLGSQDSKVESLLLSGGTSQLKGLSSFLQESLGIPVSVLDFSGLLNLALPEEKATRLNLAIGLALEGTNSFNLLPASYRLRHVREVQRSFLKVASIGVIALLGMIYLYQSWQLKHLQFQLNASRTTVKNMDLILQLKKNIDQRKNLIAMIQREELICPSLMIELSHAVPANLVLDEFNFDKQTKELVLKGIVYSRPEDSQGQLSDFIQKLQKCQFVTNVRLMTTSQIQETNQSGARFEILCNL